MNTSEKSLNRETVRMDRVIVSHGSRLDMFTFVELQPLAMAGLSLMDAINDGSLIVSDRVEPEKAAQATALIERLYALQDAIYSGQSDALSAVMTAMIEAEGGAK